MALLVPIPCDMNGIYKNILHRKQEMLMAVLLDPDKEAIETVELKMKQIHSSGATHIFVGGSSVPRQQTQQLVLEIKKYSELPVVLFPGDATQISQVADGLLFLSLLSGRNPEYLIEQHVRAIPQLLSAGLEVIPTGYLLIDGGSESSVERVSGTLPMKTDDIVKIVHTAKAGELVGMILIYLEAGSGALHPRAPKIIQAVKECVDIPVIVGGGISNKTQMKAARSAGADMVVLGTALEQNTGIFKPFQQQESF
jgi:phosphoglycerol geranylgeranyltransferase